MKICKIGLLLLVLTILFIPAAVEAKIISGWEPVHRTSVDLQVAIYAEHGYVSPVSNYYDYSAYNINADGASNSNFFQSTQRDGTFGDSEKIMIYDSSDV